MTTKRVYRKRRLKPATPAWAKDLLRGRMPGRGGDDWDGFIGWYYLNERTPGLPDSNTPEASQLVKGAEDHANEAKIKAKTPTGASQPDGGVVLSWPTPPGTT